MHDVLGLIASTAKTNQYNKKSEGKIKRYSKLNNVSFLLIHPHKHVMQNLTILLLVRLSGV